MNQIKIIGLGISAAIIITTFVVALPIVNTSHSADMSTVREERLPGIQKQLSAKKLKLGQPIFIRIFKQSRELEVWVKSDKAFVLYKTFAICTYSGDLGPKLREGDGQAPEGFYSEAKSQMNPNSNYYLAFNLGYPNAFDRYHKRTGSFLMVHGNCASIGCYAMTDKGIEEIYLLAEEALNHGQPRFVIAP